MSDNAKMVLFGSAKTVVPVRSLVPTTAFFYKLVKNWEDHEDGIIDMPGPTREFFQTDVSDIGQDSPPQRPNTQPNDDDQQDTNSPNTEQDTIVDLPQGTFSTDQDTSSGTQNPTTDQSTTNSDSSSSSSERSVADLDDPKRAPVEGKTHLHGYWSSIATAKGRTYQWKEYIPPLKIYQLPKNFEWIDSHWLGRLVPGEKKAFTHADSNGIKIFTDISDPLYLQMFPQSKPAPVLRITRQAIRQVHPAAT